VKVSHPFGWRSERGLNQTTAFQPHPTATNNQPGPPTISGDLVKSRKSHCGMFLGRNYLVSGRGHPPLFALPDVPEVTEKMCRLCVVWGHPPLSRRLRMT